MKFETPHIDWYGAVHMLAQDHPIFVMATAVLATVLVVRALRFVVD